MMWLVISLAFLIFLAIVVQFLRSKVREWTIKGHTKNLQRLKDFMLFCSLLMTFMIFVVLYLASQQGILSFGYWQKLLGM